MTSGIYRLFRSTGTPDGRRRCCWFLGSGRSWPGLVLLSVLVWQAGWVRFEGARVSQASALSGDDVPQLDSFSEPAVAMAILKQHVQNSYLAYTLGENVGNGTHWHPGDTPETRTGADLSGREPLELPKSQAAWKNGGDSAWRPLSELRGRIRSLYGESLQDLLLIHFRNRSWNSLLDSYIELLTLAPEQVDLVAWGRAALASSAICGRTDEVLDAVRHFIRFSRDSKAVARLQVVLGDWTAGRIHGLAAHDSSTP